MKKTDTDITLAEDYFDCECETNYIKYVPCGTSADMIICNICKTTLEEAPNARLNEVMEGGDQTMLEIFKDVDTLEEGETAQLATIDQCVFWLSWYSWGSAYWVSDLEGYEIISFDTLEKAFIYCSYFEM